MNLNPPQDDMNSPGVVFRWLAGGIVGVLLLGAGPAPAAEERIEARAADDGMMIRVGPTGLLRLEADGVRIEAGQKRLQARLDTTTQTGAEAASTFAFDGGEIEIRMTRSGAQALYVQTMVRPRARLALSRLGLRFRFLPLAPSAWAGCRETFHWIPNIKQRENQLAADHSFRSPAAILTSENGPGVCLVPDLDLLKQDRPCPQYLDMGFDENEPPWIEMGFASQKPVPHVYFEPTDELFEVPKEGIRFACWVMQGRREDILSQTSRFLWDRFGRPCLADLRPQVMPFSQYAEYGYDTALTHLWRRGPVEDTGGITLSTFRKPDGTWSGREHADDLWFHSWFNNARTAWGLAEWGRLLDKPQWRDKARQVIKLTVAAPREKGIFPAIYASHDGGWKGSSRQGGGPDLYHLPDAAWTAIWVRKYHDEIEPVDPAPQRLRDLSEFLIAMQDADGGFPTWVHQGTLAPDARLRGSASGALAVWFLGEELLAGAVADDRRAACLGAVSRGVDHLRRHVLPGLRFEDFELYYSCSAKPLDFYDRWTCSYGVNTPAVQWCAEAFRVAYLLNEDPADLEAGRFCVDLLALFQQVWDPPYLSFYGFGGFGVMNTDGEWNDARQAQFAETFANWYEITKQKEYLERAVAAARASFALMVCEENREICPRNYRGTPVQFEARGMMAENYGHGGRDERSGQSGFHWGTGSALTTAARLTRRYGDLYISAPPAEKTPPLALGLNGLTVSRVRLSSGRIEAELHGLAQHRPVRVRIEAPTQYDVIVNGRKLNRPDGGSLVEFRLGAAPESK